jgi:hypothetical protein
MTQTNLEIAGSARFFSSLLGILTRGNELFLMGQTLPWFVPRSMPMQVILEPPEEANNERTCLNVHRYRLPSL